MMESPGAERMRIDPIERLNLTISAGTVAASYALASPLFAASVALGSALEAMNFRALRAGAQRLFTGDLAVGQLWALAFAFRFVALAAAIFFSLRSGAHPVGLVLGLSSIVPAALAGAWLQRPPVHPAEPEPPLASDDPSWDRWSVWLARERDVAEEEAP